MSEKQKKQQNDGDDQPSSPAWMTTYGDMMTLLMTFFILIMSFSTMELDKFKAAMGSLKGALGVLGDSDKRRPEQSFFSPYQQVMRKASVVEYVERLRELISQSDIEKEVEIYMSDNEVRIQITNKILFRSGGAELKPDFLQKLSKISQTIISKAREIKIVGHSDNIPIHSKKYPSNWELSLDRALSVMKFLIYEEKISPEKLSISGYAEYQPLVSNDSPQNRAKNRRVEIYLKW